MQDVTSYVNNASPLSIAVNGGESKKISSEKTSTKSFISIMLSQLSEGASNAKVTTKATKEPVDTTETTKTLKEEKEAKSVDEHLLEDLLKIVNALKNNTQSSVFPTLKSSSRLDKVLGNETALKELGEVKSISDLMALSKKYNLGLEKLSFSKESVENLQKEFPVLAKNNFFESLQDEVKTQKSTTESKPLMPSISPLEKQVQKSENLTPVSALKELMSKESTDEPKVVTSTQKVEIKETLKTVPTQELLVEEKTQTPKEIKTTETISTESKKSISNPIEVAVQKVVAQTAEEIKAEKKAKIEPVLTTSTEEEVVEIKSSAQTRVSEQKVENNTTQKGLTETILQAIKTEKPILEKKPDESQIVAQASAPLHEEPIKIESTETKPNTIEVKTIQRQETTLKQPSTPKESLNQFASDLREKIETYKPPIMKVELTLNPRNLGEVDVTLLTRGTNLHVNISSNSNTMTLFTQNQAEFKNALVNMGFTNLEMNFSDQQKNQQQQNNRQNNHQSFDELAGETSNETMASIEVILPQYV